MASSRTAQIPLLDLLTAVADSPESAKQIEFILSPAGYLHVIPLLSIYRTGMGDPVLRRTKLWNARGYLWIDVETWDHLGGFFEHDVIPIARIKDAASILIPNPLKKLELDYAQSLSRSGNTTTLHQYRMRAHAAIEEHLSRLGARLKEEYQKTPLLVDEAMDRQIYESREGIVELCFNQSILATASIKACDMPVSEILYVNRRQILKEAMPGRACQQTYSIIRNSLPDNQASYAIEELYDSEIVGQKICRLHQLNPPATRSSDFVFFPLATLEALLSEHSNFAHWRYNVSRKKADQTVFARTIHTSADFASTRDYLAASIGQSWSNTVTQGSKWDIVALILSASTFPRCNVQISRRIRIARTNTSLNRLVFQGGLATALIAKHSWILGWYDHAASIPSVTIPFLPLYSPQRRAVVS